MRFLATLACATVLAAPVFAGGHITWTSVDDQSSIAFGSVKSNEIGEVHTFSKVSGKVGEKGGVSISIDLGSVETNIDIRNERMIEHVFQAGQATATLAGEVDMDQVNGMDVGSTKLVEFDGALTFAGAEVDVYTNLLVARLTEDRVLVTTADMVMVSTDELGIDAGIDKLMELAGLPGITRVAPVTIRMVFEK